MSEYIGNRIVPTHGGVWNSAKSYEPLVIVYEEGTGDSYISRKDVPAGTGLEQEDYWALCSRFSEQMELYQEDVDAAVALTNSNKSTLNSRMDSLETRLDANVSASTDADADYAAEVVDARVGYDEKTYENLGKAIREQTGNLAEKQNAFSSAGIYASGEWEDVTESLTITNDSWINYNGKKGSDISNETLGYPSCTSPFEVTPGEQYRVSGKASNDLAIVILSTEADFSTGDCLAFYHFSGASKVVEDADIIIPCGYQYMVVQTRNTDKNPISVKKYSPDTAGYFENTPSRMSDRIADMESEFTEQVSELEVKADYAVKTSTSGVFADGEWEDITDSVDLVEKSWLMNTGKEGATVGSDSSGYPSRTEPIPVEPNEMYRVSGKASNNLAVVVLSSDEDFAVGNTVAYFLGRDYEDSLVAYCDDVDLIIPYGYSYMVVQTRDSTKWPVKVLQFNPSADAFKFMPQALSERIEENASNINDVQNSVAVLETKAESKDFFDWLSRDVLHQVYAATRNSSYGFSEMDCGYVSIVIDDLRSDIDLVASIIVGDYGFPLCLAAIPSRLENTVTGLEENRIGETCQDICDYVVENGGEILAHNSGVLTQEKAENEDSCYSYFVATKKALFDAGYNVNGIILAGGTGQISGKNDTSGNMDRYVRCFYQYSDLCGKSSPYYNPRTSMAKTTYEKWTAAIDSVVEGKTWMPTHCHGINQDGTTAYENGFQESDLINCLDYIKNYVDQGLLKVVTYYDVYNTFGGYGK